MPIHYFEDPQNRERKLTRDIAQIHLSTIALALELVGKGVPMFEIPKQLYGAQGDVDLLIFYEPDSEKEALVACEIKTIHLTRSGELKSVKAKKSNKQLENLRRDGFDYIWLLEFIVTEPAGSWFHPQAGDALFQETAKIANPSFGHAKFQIGAVAEKPESDAGSIGWKVVRPAVRQPVTDNRARLRERIYAEAARLGG